MSSESYRELTASHKTASLPRPGSLEDRLIKTYGKRPGGCLLQLIILVLSLLIFIYMIAVVFCAAIVVNSSSQISEIVNLITIAVITVGLLGYVVFASTASDTSNIQKSLNRYFSMQATIAVFAFVQTFFWMIDAHNPNADHESRSVFLLSMSAFLAYYRDKFTAFMLRLARLSHKDAGDGGVLPFEETESLTTD